MEETVVLNRSKPNGTLPSIAKMSTREAQSLHQWREKRILDLISIGQPYHEGSFIESKFDMFATHIKACVQLLQNRAYYSEIYGEDIVSKASGRWVIPVLAADTLQIHNNLFCLVRELKEKNVDLNNEDILAEKKKEIEAEQLRDWLLKGKRFKESCEIHFKKLKEAGKATIDGIEQQAVAVFPYCITWHDLLDGKVEVLVDLDSPLVSQQSPELFEFKTTYEYLMMTYNNEERICQEPKDPSESCEIYLSVNNQGYDYIERDPERLIRFLKAMTPEERLQHKGLSTALNSDASLKVKFDTKGLKFDRCVRLFEENLKYILIEFAFMCEALAKGSCLPPHFDLSCPTHIAYPGPPGDAFNKIQSELKKRRVNSEIYSEVNWLEFAMHNVVLTELPSYIQKIHTGAEFVGMSRSMSPELESQPQPYLNLYWNLIILKQAGPIEHPDFNAAALSRKEIQVYDLPAADSRFVCREEIKSQLDDLFSQRPSENSATQKVVLACLQGLGGMGKTQLALDYCHRHKASYSMIIWVNAADQKESSKVFKQLAIALDLISPKDVTHDDLAILKLHDFLAEHPGWLMVFDDLHEDMVREEFEQNTAQDTKKKSKQKYQACIPNTGGHVLATSRIEIKQQGKNYVSVGPMFEHESVNLLRKILGLRYSESELQELAKTLGHYPLAMTLAAAYLAAEPIIMPMENYIQEYRNSAKIIDVDRRNISKEHNQKINPADHKKRVHATLAGIIYKISPNNKNPSIAREMLSVMSFLDGTGIPAEFLWAWYQDRYQHRYEDRYEVIDSYSYDYSLELLKKYFLVREESCSVLTMHRVIQDVLRELSVPQIEQSYRELVCSDVQQKWHGRIVKVFLTMGFPIEFTMAAAQKIGDKKSRELFCKNAIYYIQASMSYCFNQSPDYLYFLQTLVWGESVLRGNSNNGFLVSLFELYMIEQFFPNHEFANLCRENLTKMPRILGVSNFNTLNDWQLRTVATNQNSGNAFTELLSNNIFIYMRLALIGVTLPDTVFKYVWLKNKEAIELIRFSPLDNDIKVMFTRIPINIALSEFLEYRNGMYENNEQVFFNRFWHILKISSNYCSDKSFLTLALIGIKEYKLLTSNSINRMNCLLKKLYFHYRDERPHSNLRCEIYNLFIAYANYLLDVVGDYQAAIKVYEEAGNFYEEGTGPNLQTLEDSKKRAQKELTEGNLYSRSLTFDEGTQYLVDELFQNRFFYNDGELFDREGCINELTELHQEFCHKHAHITYELSKQSEAKPITCSEVVIHINDPSVNEFFQKIIFSQYRKPNSEMTMRQVLEEIIKDGNDSALKIIKHLLEQQKRSLSECHEMLLPYFVRYFSLAAFKELSSEKKEGCYNCIRMLLHAGYNPNLPNEGNKTCFDLAQGDEKILQILTPFKSSTRPESSHANNFRF